MSHRLKVNRFSSYRNDSYDSDDKYTRMAERLARKPDESWQQKLMNEAEERDHRKNGSYTTSTVPRESERRQSDPVLFLLNELRKCQAIHDYAEVLSKANNQLETQVYGFEVTGKRASDFFKLYSSLHDNFIYLASKENGDERFKCLSFAETCAEKAHLVMSRHYARPKPEILEEWAVKIKEAKDAQLKLVLDELAPVADASNPEVRCKNLGETADYLEKRAKVLGSAIFYGKISELRLEKARLHLSFAKEMIGSCAAGGGITDELEAAKSAAKGAMGNISGSQSPGASLLLGEILLLQAWRQILDSGPKDEKVGEIFSSISSCFWSGARTTDDSCGANHIPVSGWFYPNSASENLEKFSLGRVRLPEKDGFRYYSSKGGLLAIKKNKGAFRVFRLEGQLISDDVRAKIFAAQIKYLHGLSLMHAGNNQGATIAFHDAFEGLGGFFAIKMGQEAAHHTSFSNVEFNPATGIAVNSGFIKSISCPDCFSQNKNEDGKAYKTDLKAASVLYGVTMGLRYSALCAYALLSDNLEFKKIIGSFDPGNIHAQKGGDPYSEAMIREYNGLSASFWIVHSALAFKKKD